MAKNKGLRKAAKHKNDEFYTDLTDIEKEMRFTLALGLQMPKDISQKRVVLQMD